MTTARNVPMFEKPEEQPMALSRALSSPEYRLGRDQKARWTSVKFKTPRPCQECCCVQHETDGRFGPRRQTKRRRTQALGPPLDLCAAHADLWKDRDAADSGIAKST